MTMTKAKLIEHLERLGACGPALDWVIDAGRKSPARLWETCERADWLLWLACAAGVDRKELVMAACACARTSLVHVPAGEMRLRAIENAEAWCRGEAPTEVMHNPYANAAYPDAAASYASFAAFAARCSCSCAADAAADAMACAADAADDDAAAAWDDAMAAMASIVRDRITWEMVRAALEVTP